MGESSAGSYLADPTSPIPSHCASVVTTSTVRVKGISYVILVQMLLPKYNSAVNNQPVVMNDVWFCLFFVHKINMVVYFPILVGG